MPVAMVSSTGNIIPETVDLRPAHTMTSVKSGSAFAAMLKPLDSAGKAIPRSDSDPYVQMEAVFLRNFVEAMLPKQESGMIDSGMAGDYWRSMLADQISTAVAVTGKMGIADILRSRTSAVQTPGE